MRVFVPNDEPEEWEGQHGPFDRRVYVVTNIKRRTFTIDTQDDMLMLVSHILQLSHRPSLVNWIRPATHLDRVTLLADLRAEELDHPYWQQGLIELRQNRVLTAVVCFSRAFRLEVRFQRQRGPGIRFVVRQSVERTASIRLINRCQQRELKHLAIHRFASYCDVRGAFAGDIDLPLPAAIILEGFRKDEPDAALKGILQNNTDFERFKTLPGAHIQSPERFAEDFIVVDLEREGTIVQLVELLISRRQEAKRKAKLKAGLKTAPATVPSQHRVQKHPLKQKSQNARNSLANQVLIKNMVGFRNPPFGTSSYLTLL